MVARSPWIWRRPFLLIAVASLPLVVACGYRPAITRSTVSVEPITVLVPYPELAECLTRELRLGLAARTSASPGARSFSLEADLAGASASPAALARRGDELRPLDQIVELILRVRIARPGGGVVWGPTSYRVERRASQGPDAVSSWSSAGEAMGRACREVAQDVVDDATAFLSTR